MPAPVYPSTDPRDGYVSFTNIPEMSPDDGYIGPHQYRLAVSANFEPESVSGIPKGTVFAPAGYSHALLPDLSLATYQYYKIAKGKNARGQDFVAWVGPARVE